MTAAEFVSSTRNRFERLFDALADPARCERTMLVVLLSYLATWSLYATIAKSSQDIHTDMGEMVAWAHDAGLGTPKHPPLAAWLARAWFSVLPRQDWAYYGLAILLATIALWIAWRLSARYLPRDKRVAGIALLTLVPFYNVHAIKFNANTVLTPLWALTTWWFLCSFATRRVGWAALTAIAAAAAMLGKYWSVTLLAGLGVAALSDRRRDAYFNSPAPYVTLAVGTILLTPHIDWLIAHQFVPFSYAVEAHPATFVTAAISAVYFIGASLCYIAAPVVLALLAARPSVAAIVDALRPADPERRMPVVAFAAPFAFAILIALLLTVEIESLWAISMMTLLPVVLLSSPLVSLPRRAAVSLVALAVVFPLLMLLSAPLSAIYDHRKGVQNYASDYRLVARAVERAWRARTDQPLRIVGSVNFVNGIVFYFTDQPATFDLDIPALTPWVSDDRIRRDGMAMVCPEPEPFCMRALPGYAARYHAIADEHIVVSRRYLGIAGKPQRYEIVIILPQQS
jgi:Dolichyl-phosphate-mannose-protein mannosyltransferase